MNKVSQLAEHATGDSLVGRDHDPSARHEPEPGLVIDLVPVRRAPVHLPGNPYFLVFEAPVHVLGLAHNASECLPRELLVRVEYVLQRRLHRMYVSNDLITS